MPRTKKQQKLQKRSWDDDEDVRCYDVVLKNPIFYKQPIQSHGKCILYGDVIIDVNSFTQNQSYIPKLQLGLVRLNKIVKLIKEESIVLYTESLYPQITDFSSIIKIVNSIPSQEMHQLGQVLEKYQQNTNRQLKLLESRDGCKSVQVPLHYDPEQLLQKCFEIAKKHLDYEGQIYAFNLYIFDPEKKRLNRHLLSNHIKLMQLLCDDEEELKRRFLSYKFNQPQGDMNQFIKIQIPQVEDAVDDYIKLYTFDNYILSAKVTQQCYKLSENSNNQLMLRKYNFDHEAIEELKRVRQVRKQHAQQLTSQLLLDSSSNSNQQQTPTASHEYISAYDESFGSIQTFLPKYDPNQLNQDD